MFSLLLLVLPLLAEGASSDSVGCVLPAASTETFYMTTEEKPWYQQYQYQVPGLFDLGCVTYVQSPGESDTEMYLTGNFSKAPLFPLNSYVSVTGNKLDKVYDGVWESLLSGPYNVVYSHEDFIMDHYCFLGYVSLMERSSGNKWTLFCSMLDQIDILPFILRTFRSP
ncbi:uncharacterized protein LOC126413325 isoform X2 [Schistocerca serialis cubense]|uniref:uncharacterized protein LOC126413325 isoform X2 n=1 Tax=Schistocerca serialis cubense TaxID=2023355 RepID=UPI00214F1B41|nr:uncharacterized protein LOC126413325 isoform X2 [Schistocerca serialis cubense]